MSLETLWPWLIYGWVGLEAVVSIATRTRRGQGTRARPRNATHHLGGDRVVVFRRGRGLGGVSRRGYAPRSPCPALGRRWSLIVAGLAVRIAAIVTLGRSFSANVAIRSTQTVQRKGLYRVVRHPSYLGMEIIFLAAGIHAHNWASLAIVFVLPTIAVLYRIHVEEAALLGAFGGEYAEYMRATKRLIPGVY